jgi:hypothetical protein
LTPDGLTTCRPQNIIHSSLGFRGVSADPSSDDPIRVIRGNFFRPNVQS